MQRPDLMPDHVLRATIAQLEGVRNSGRLSVTDGRRLAALVFEQEHRTKGQPAAPLPPHGGTP